MAATAVIPPQHAAKQAAQQAALACGLGSAVREEGNQRWFRKGSMRHNLCAASHSPSQTPIGCTFPCSGAPTTGKCQHRLRSQSALLMGADVVDAAPSSAAQQTASDQPPPSSKSSVCAASKEACSPTSRRPRRCCSCAGTTKSHPSYGCLPMHNRFNHGAFDRLAASYTPRALRTLCSWVWNVSPEATQADL